MGDKKKASPEAKQANKAARAETKTGHKGAEKNPQEPLALVLMGKGVFQSLPKSPGPAFAVTGGAPGSFDPVQAQINKDLGYW